MQVQKALMLTVVAAVLVACGGDGGSDSAVAPNPPAAPIDYPLRTAYVNYITTTGSSSFTVTGNYSIDGQNLPITGSGTGTWGAISAATFEGIPAQKKATTIIGSAAAAGISIPLSATEYSYYDSNYNPLGGSGTQYEVVMTSNPIPATARVNDTGSWYTSNRYATSAKTNLLGTRSTSYVVQQDTATTAFLSIIATDKAIGGATTATSTAKFRMTTTGSLTRVNEIGVIYTSSPVAVMTLNINY